MKKRPYRKPELKTCKFALGVFGDYANGDRVMPDTGNTLGPKAGIVGVVENLGLRME